MCIYLNWLEFTHVGQYPTLVSETSRSNERVYPNPVTNQLFIETSNTDGTTEVSILDISGRLFFSKIFSNATSRMEVDFNSFKKSSYLVRTKNSGNIMNHLIVK